MSYVIVARGERGDLQDASAGNEAGGLGAADPAKPDARGQKRIVGPPLKRKRHLLFDTCSSIRTPCAESGADHSLEIGRWAVPRSTGTAVWRDCKARKWGDVLPRTNVKQHRVARYNGEVITEGTLPSPDRNSPHDA